MNRVISKGMVTAAIILLFIVAFSLSRIIEMLVSNYQ